MKTKTTVRHARTPWEITLSLEDRNSDWKCQIGPKDSLAVAYAWGINRQDVEANAAFILKAVNCHEEMLEVLKRVSEFLDRDVDDGILYGSTMYDDSTTFRWMMKHVIAKVEGKQ